VLADTSSKSCVGGGTRLGRRERNGTKLLSDQCIIRGTKLRARNTKRKRGEKPSWPREGFVECEKTTRIEREVRAEKETHQKVQQFGGTELSRKKGGGELVRGTLGGAQAKSNTNWEGRGKTRITDTNAKKILRRPR